MARIAALLLPVAGGVDLPRAARAEGDAKDDFRHTLEAAGAAARDNRPSGSDDVAATGRRRRRDLREREAGEPERPHRATVGRPGSDEVAAGRPARPRRETGPTAAGETETTAAGTAMAPGEVGSRVEAQDAGDRGDLTAASTVDTAAPSDGAAATGSGAAGPAAVAAPGTASATPPAAAPGLAAAAPEAPHVSEAGHTPEAPRVPQSGAVPAAPAHGEGPATPASPPAPASSATLASAAGNAVAAPGARGAGPDPSTNAAVDHAAATSADGTGSAESPASDPAPRRDVASMPARLQAPDARLDPNPRGDTAPRAAIDATMPVDRPGLTISSGHPPPAGDAQVPARERTLPTAPPGAIPAVPAGQAPATPAVPAQGGDRPGGAVEQEARSEPAATAAPRVVAASSSAGTPEAPAPPDRAAAPRTTLEAAADRLLADVLGRAKAFGGRHGPGLETTLRVADLGVLRLVLEGQPGDVRASLVARDEHVAEALMRAVERAGRAVDAPAGLAISVRAETASAGRDGLPWTADAPVDGDGGQRSRNAHSDLRDQGPGPGDRAAARRRAGGLDVLA